MFFDSVMTVGEEVGPVSCKGEEFIDIFISGLTSGAVQLYVHYKETLETSNPGWMEYPDGLFTEDVAKIIDVSENGVTFKLVGVANNAGAYARLARKV